MQKFVLPNYLQLDKLEHVDDAGLLDEPATKASERLSAISAGAEKEVELIIAEHKSFGQHVHKQQNIGFTTESDIEAMDFKFLCPGCDMPFP